MATMGWTDRFFRIWRGGGAFRLEGYGWAALRVRRLPHRLADSHTVLQLQIEWEGEGTGAPSCGHTAGHAL